METTTLEQPPVEVEKLLIYTNEIEISKITQDARIRANVLNEVISAGVSANQIKDVTSSEKTIENYIFDRHLKQNKRMAMEYSSGKRQRSLIEDYILPTNLEDTQRKLLNWLSLPTHRGADKYLHLQFNEGKFELDSQSLEKEFVKQRLKFYIAGEQVNEFRDIEELCKCFEKYQMPNNQIRESSFLWNRIEPLGMHQYKPRATWFMRERN